MSWQCADLDGRYLDAACTLSPRTSVRQASSSQRGAGRSKASVEAWLRSVRLQCSLLASRYSDAVSTPPVSSQDLRAAAEAHRELGPEYSDAVVDSFMAKLEARLDERVNARLAELTRPRRRMLARLSRDRRRGLITGAMIGWGGLGVPLFLHLYSGARYWMGTARDLWAVLLVVSAGLCGAGFARIIRRTD